MNTLAQIYQKYGGYEWPGSDKGTIHSYIEIYEHILAPYRQKAQVTVLEIGIMGGNSLRMWEEYFHNGVVYGVDLCDQPLGMMDLRPMIAEGTHKIVLMNAADAKQVEEHFSGRQFDVVIDDASHSLDDQLAMYQNFKNRLAPDGIYIIEDIDHIEERRQIFAEIDPTKRVAILDRRKVKGRFDDVLVVIGWPSTQLCSDPEIVSIA